MGRRVDRRRVASPGSRPETGLLRRLCTGRDAPCRPHCDVATMTPRRRHIGDVMTEAGIRDLRDHLSRYLERVQDGEELTGPAATRVVGLLRPRVAAGRT